MKPNQDLVLVPGEGKEWMMAVINAILEQSRSGVIQIFTFYTLPAPAALF